MKQTSTTLLGTLLFLCTLLWTGCDGVRCYWCVYVSKNSDSQSSCSDPWPWYRETFGNMYKPPVRDCPFSDMCVKIIVKNRDGHHSVVRACESACNESLSSTTITTCCQGELCNHGNKYTSPLAMVTLVAVLACIVGGHLT